MILMKVDNEKLSLAIQSIRKYLLKENFFDVHLYSTNTYIIENTRFFQLKDALFLRVNPEPDIWKTGTSYPKFFWIGSLFRNEKCLSTLHSYEFTVVDIYEKGRKEQVKKRFSSILNQLERDLSLQPLSKSFVEVDYGFSSDAICEEECWVLIKNYPKNKSFYDRDNGNGTTQKFELFYKKKDELVEIVACGELGENVNPEQFIKNENDFVQRDSFQKGLVGFGIGLERLLLLYSRIDS